MESHLQRLLKLKEKPEENGFELIDGQIQLLEKFYPEFRDRKIETKHVGYLFSFDTFMVGTFKGVGRVYLQTVIDCHSHHVWGRLYTNKVPITAVHVMNNDVLPFFEKHGVKVKNVLTDNGREYCGWPDRHPFELFLQLEVIEPKTATVR